jgi:hypothetical protein
VTHYNKSGDPVRTEHTSLKIDHADPKYHEENKGFGEAKAATELRHESAQKLNEARQDPQARFKEAKAKADKATRALSEARNSQMLKGFKTSPEEIQRLTEEHANAVAEFRVAHNKMATATSAWRKEDRKDRANQNSQKAKAELKAQGFKTKAEKEKADSDAREAERARLNREIDERAERGRRAELKRREEESRPIREEHERQAAEQKAASEKARSAQESDRRANMTEEQKMHEWAHTNQATGYEAIWDDKTAQIGSTKSRRLLAHWKAGTSPVLSEWGLGGAPHTPKIST